jgi:hypothetical protein
MDLFSLSIFHGSCNDRLLQLIECIESSRSEVKRKMIRARVSNDAPRSWLDARTRRKLRRDHLDAGQNAVVREEIFIAAGRSSAYLRGTAFSESSSEIAFAQRKLSGSPCRFAG